MSMTVTIHVTKLGTNDTFCGLKQKHVNLEAKIQYCKRCSKTLAFERLQEERAIDAGRMIAGWE